MEKPEPCLPLATSGRKKWKGLMAAPHPMVYLGPQHFGQWAQRLTRTLQQGGSPAFGEELAKSIELVIDLQFGFGVGATAMRRLGPLVQRILSGYIHEPYEPGKGQRYVPSYLRGLMPEQPFHDPKDHPWHKELVKHHAMMLEEAKERGQPWHWKGGDNETMVREYAQQWRGLSWVKYGMWAEGYEDFPKACNVIESLVGVRMYECLIAKLPPGAGVAPHSDNNNYILTVHIGLELEEDGCTITVGDQTREWGVGEALAFDHTYIHSVYNDSDRDRYVMIIRFWHPDCTDEERYGLIFLNLIVREIKLMGGGEELFTRPDCESSQKYTSPSQPALVGGNFATRPPRGTPAPKPILDHYVRLKVKSKSGKDIVEAKMLTRGPMKVMFHMACDKLGLGKWSCERDSTFYNSKGTKLQPTDTPETLAMEDNEEITILRNTANLHGKYAHKEREELEVATKQESKEEESHEQGGQDE